MWLHSRRYISHVRHNIGCHPLSLERNGWKDARSQNERIDKQRKLTITEFNLQYVQNSIPMIIPFFISVCLTDIISQLRARVISLCDSIWCFRRRITHHSKNIHAVVLFYESYTPHLSPNAYRRPGCSENARVWATTPLPQSHTYLLRIVSGSALPDFWRHCRNEIWYTVLSSSYVEVMTWADTYITALLSSEHGCW